MIAALYQSIVSFAFTLAVSEGMVTPWQITLLPPLTGAFTTGHVQFGAVTGNVVVHPFNADVIIKPESFGIPLIILFILSTMPLVLLTVPLLLKLILYVNKSAEQVVLIALKVGMRLFVRDITVRLELLQPVIVFLASA